MRKGSVFNFHFDTGRVLDYVRMQTAQTVLDVKGNPCLRGGKRVGDPGLRIERAQLVKQRLIGNFPG